MDKTKQNKLFVLLFILAFANVVFSQANDDEVTFRNSKGKAELINFSKTKIKSDDIAVKDFFRKQYNTKEETDYTEIPNSTVKQNGFDSKKYQQYYKGLKVEFGTQNSVSENGIVKTVNGRHVTIINLNIIPRLSEKAALNFALKSIGAKNYMWEDKVNEAFLKKERNDLNATYFPKGELLVIEKDLFGENPTPVLAYKFNVYAIYPISRDYIYVDANSGAIILRDPTIIDVQGNGSTRYSGQRTFETQQSGTQYKLRDYTRGSGIETYNMNHNVLPNFNLSTDFIDNDNNWTSAEFNNTNKDNAALDAHWGAEKTYDYFLIKHNRNSFDGIGTIIKNYVHYSNAYENAGWLGVDKVMIYGDGGYTFSPLTSVDVIGHEIGHGVCFSTANLIYSEESGAINEGLSDIWGAMVEYFADPTKQTYLIGEEIKLGGGALRSMSSPKSYTQPDTYNETNWYTGTDQSYKVHTNSGVMNHWFYILAEGKSGTNDIGNAYNITGISKDKAANIVYRAESVYFQSTTNYSQARNLTIQASNDLYGVNSTESITVGNSWYAVGVGIYIPPPTPPYVGKPYVYMNNYCPDPYQTTCYGNPYFQANNVTSLMLDAIGRSTAFDSDWEWEKVQGNFTFASYGPGGSAQVINNGTKSIGRIANFQVPANSGQIMVKARAKNSTYGWGDYKYFIWNGSSSNLTNTAMIYQIYPNPTNDIVNVSLIDETLKPITDSKIIAELYDFKGVLKRTEEVKNNIASIDIRGLIQGIYILKIDIGGQVESHQIIVE